MFFYLGLSYTSFRGALDVRASTINDVSENCRRQNALAELAREDADDVAAGLSGRCRLASARNNIFRCRSIRV